MQRGQCVDLHSGYLSSLYLLQLGTKRAPVWINFQLSVYNVQMCCRSLFIYLATLPCAQSAFHRMRLTVSPITITLNVKTYAITWSANTSLTNMAVIRIPWALLLLPTPSSRFPLQIIVIIDVYCLSLSQCFYYLWLQDSRASWFIIVSACHFIGMVFLTITSAN